MRKILVLAATALAMIGLPGTALAQPSNDDFTNATVVIEPLPFTDFVSTGDATAAADDPDCLGNGATVWYSYTPSADGLINANTFGSDYDTTLSVYTGERGSLSQVACNDDTGGLQSSVTWEAVAGTTYRLMAGSFGGGPGGNLSFTVQQGEQPPPPPPPPPALEIDLVVDETGRVDSRSGVATISGTVTCSQPSWTYLYGELSQRVGRQLINGYFFAEVECDGETPWSATVEGDGIFAGGPAQVRAQAFACTFDSCDEAETTADIRLRSGRS